MTLQSYLANPWCYSESPGFGVHWSFAVERRKRGHLKCFVILSSLGSKFAISGSEELKHEHSALLAPGIKHPRVASFPGGGAYLYTLSCSSRDVDFSPLSAQAWALCCVPDPGLGPELWGWDADGVATSRGGGSFPHFPREPLWARHSCSPRVFLPENDEGSWGESCSLSVFHGLGTDEAVDTEIPASHSHAPTGHSAIPCLRVNGVRVGIRRHASWGSKREAQCSQQG